MTTKQLNKKFQDIANRHLSEYQKNLEPRACLDQYFGRVALIEKAENLSVRHPVAARPAKQNCLLLILESPHIKEFVDEPGPAKGTTGTNIARLLRDVPGLKADGEYGLILINAVQHQCSLGFPTGEFRDQVFREVWSNGGKEDFTTRLKTIYKLGDKVINCCTKGKIRASTDELRVLVQRAIEQALPGVTVLRRNHPASWHFSSNRQREWQTNEKKG